MLDSPPLCRSIGVRSAAAIELQPPAASDRTLELLDQMLSEVDRTASELLEPDDGNGHVGLIAKLLERLDALSMRSGGAQLKPLTVRLKARLLPLMDGPATTVPDLSLISEFVASQVRQLYAKKLNSAADDIPSPKMRALCVRADSIHAYFDQFGVNASTKVRSKNIVVSLELLPDRLDITALSQVLYVLAHEVVCHAYQSLDHPERTNSDDTCGWTDGWMDTLAWRLTEAWIMREKTRLPSWLTCVPEEAKRRCRRFHDRRYEDPRRPPLRRSDLAQRRLARSSFDMLYGAWGEASAAGVDVEQHRATTFSLILNHTKVDEETRRLLVAALSTALDPFRGRDIEVAGVCSDFLRHRDAQALLRDLEALSELP